MQDGRAEIVPPAQVVLLASYAYAVLVAIGMGHCLLAIPIQVSDSFNNMLSLNTSWGELLSGQFSQRAYLRPFLWAELKLVYDWSGGAYSAWFRGTQAVQVAILATMFVHLVKPRTWRDVAGLSIALAVLIGHHTFAGTVIEAFPINTFLTIVLCCFAAAVVSLAEYRWWNDLAAIALFVIAALTLESGLLVGVILIGARLVGAPGVSRGGVIAVVFLVAAYFAARFLYLDVGTPGLEERSSGFGFQQLQPDELKARFAQNPYPFYLYNVVSSMGSVLFAEPRGGVFSLVGAVAAGERRPDLVVASIAAMVTTGLIVRYGWERRHDWMARRFDRHDRLWLLCALVLAANAAISYPYTKDVIMSPAGAFFALAAYVSVRGILNEIHTGRGWTRRAASVALLVVAATWTIRAGGIHLRLRDTATTVRTEWVYDPAPAATDTDPDATAARELHDLLSSEAIIHRPPPPLDVPFGDLFERP